ncbi:MAG: hypothetical protein U0359_03540 [Byssovorax sp.]
MFVGAGLLTGTLALGSSMAGCQSNSTSTSSSSTTTGSGGSSSTTSTSGTGGNTGSGGMTGSGGNTGSGGDTTGTGGNAGPTDATIQDVTTNKVGPGLKVKLTGVVAMTQKFLVSKGSQSGSCLWGVFVSAPNIAETAENTGILVLSYGDNATIPDGGSQSFCPRLGIDPIGDQIPDDTKPGDVLDVTGETSYFLLPNCASQPDGSTVAEYQIAKSSAVTKTGTATPPKAHVLTPAEMVMAADPNNQAFHDKWGGVKVAIENVVSEAQDDGMGGMGITDKFGHILVHDKANANPAPTDKLQLGDKLYYRGYLKKNNACYDGPKFANAVTEFAHMEGISYMDFCTWNLQPNDKCADLTPSSEDCTSDVMCVQ